MVDVVLLDGANPKISIETDNAQEQIAAPLGSGVLFDTDIKVKFNGGADYIHTVDDPIVAVPVSAPTVDVFTPNGATRVARKTDPAIALNVDPSDE